MKKILNGTALGAVLLQTAFSLWIPAGTLTHWFISWHNRPLPAAYLIFILLAGLYTSITFIDVWHKIHPIDLLLGGLLAVWTLSSLAGIDRTMSFQTVVGQFSKGILAGWCVFRLVRTPRQARWIMRLVTLMIMVAATVGIAEFATNGIPFFRRVYGINSRIVGTVGHPLPLGALIVSGMLMLLACWPSNPWVTVAGQAWLGGALALTFSRSSWLVAVVTGIFAAIQEKTWGKLIFCTLVSTVTLFMLLIVIVVAHGDFARLQTLQYTVTQRFTLHRVDESNDHAVRLGSWYLPLTHHRLASYATSFRMLKSHPLLGIGPGAFPTAYETYKSEGSSDTIPSPDNMLLRLLAETGILGFAAWIGLMVIWVKTSLHRLQSGTGDEILLRKALFMAAASLWLNSLFFDSLYWNPTLITLTILMALSAGDWQTTA